MKFYNLTKMNVNVGDTVYNAIGGFYEQITFVDRQGIHTKVCDGRMMNYSITGLLAGYVEWDNLPTTKVCHLINNNVTRIHAHEIL